MLRKPLRIVVTGGGTGGHTLPAIATVQKIREIVRQHYADLDLSILYIGSRSGLEVRLSREAAIEFFPLATGKLRRASNPLRIINLENLRDLFKVPQGFFQALSKVRAFKPSVVFSTGGYVSVPTVIAARLLNVPILMHEQTVQIGLANRLSARLSARVALSFAESADELSAKDRGKSFFTGSVIRPIVVDGDANAARQRYHFAELAERLPVIYVTGGAQGSSIINHAVQVALKRLTSVCCIIHQCGRQKAGTVQDEEILKTAAAELPDYLRHRYAVTTYVGNEIGDVYALSDLVIGRSGAGTVSEVCAVGKAALFIPLVPTGGDEQTRNARRLELLGAAVSIKQGDLTGDLLAETVERLLADPIKLKQMGLAAKAEYRPEATEALANAVIELGLRSRNHE